MAKNMKIFNALELRRKEVKTSELEEKVCDENSSSETEKSSNINSETISGQNESIKIEKVKDDGTCDVELEINLDEYNEEEDMSDNIDCDEEYECSSEVSESESFFVPKRRQALTKKARQKKRPKRSNSSHTEGSTKAKYKCSECGIGFNSTGERKKHVIDEHGVFPFTCSFSNCEKEFITKYDCKRHEFTVHSDKKFHVCDLCPMRFNRAGALQNHIYCVHTDVKDKTQFKCEECDKVFYAKGKLDLHKSVHTGEKKFVCPIDDCGRSFRLKSNLTKHEKVHANIKPFECETCGEKFSRKAYLDAHMHKHTGVKEFVCEVCSKEFSTKGNLTVHMKMHSSDRPEWKCFVCPRSFHFKSNYTKHLKQNHDLEFSPTHSKLIQKRKPKVEKQIVEVGNEDTDKVSPSVKCITTPDDFEVLKKKCELSEKPFKGIYIVKSLLYNHSNSGSSSLKLAPDLYPKSGSKDMISSSEIVVIRASDVPNGGQSETRSPTVEFLAEKIETVVPDLLSASLNVINKPEVTSTEEFNSSPSPVSVIHPANSLLPKKQSSISKSLIMTNDRLTGLAEKNVTLKKSAREDLQKKLLSRSVASSVSENECGSSKKVKIIETELKRLPDSESNSTLFCPEDSSEILSISSKKTSAEKYVSLLNVPGKREIIPRVVENPEKVLGFHKYAIQNSLIGDIGKQAQSSARSLEVETCDLAKKVESASSTSGQDESCSPEPSEGPVDSALMDTIFMDLFQKNKHVKAESEHNSDNYALSEEDVRSLLLQDN